MMLILTSKFGESLQIDNNIKITLLNDKHNQVKIGVNASNDIEIRREEINENSQGEEQTGNRDV